MKKVSRPQYHRIRLILTMIRSGTRSGNLSSARHFAEQLGVTWRTIMRDLDFLRDDEGAPIEYDATRKGYYLSDDTWRLPPIELNRGEVFAFSIAGKLLERFQGTALDVDMSSLMQKVAESLDGNVTLDIESLTERFTVLQEDYVVQDPAIWKRLAAYMDNAEQIMVQYRKFNGAVKKYVLNPYHLLAYHGNWYLLAETTGNDKIATFAVSRILEMAPTGLTFKMPESFSVQDHMKALFGITGGEKPFDVRLRFMPGISAYIKERVWHPTQQITERRDGSIELRMRTAGWKELVRWILSWQPDVHVISPKRLRERVAEKLRQGLENF